MGGKGESEFNVCAGCILARGSKVTNELVKLLDVEVCLPQLINRRVGFKGSVKGGVEVRVSEEEGEKNIVVFVVFLEVAGEGIRGGGHVVLFLGRARG